MRTWIALAAALLLGGPASAGADEGSELFEKRIRPVLAARCVECHGARAAKPKGGLSVDTLAAILRGGARGPAVIPGDPDRSLLVGAIRRENDDLAMPPKASERLTETEIQDFVAWIRKGAPGPREKPAAARTTTHWSFAKPKAVEPPPVRRTDWPVTPIDRFILAELEKRGLSPAPPADPATLLRRATFTLTGLPPSPGDVDAFLRDPAPDALDRAVERLLASPQYGERWARHWLDVARYADTRGGTQNARFPYAYTYRDWVVRAFNEDLPFDRFILLQLAADRVEGAKPEDRAALGFLTVGRQFTVAADAIDDRIDVVTRGFLGITVTCARCHDHKFDPVPTADYYSLYGVFAASQEPRELPLLGVSGPAQDAYEKERARRQAAADGFLEVRRAEELKRIRTPEQIAACLLASAELKGQSDAETRTQVAARGLKPDVAKRWIDFLAARARKHDPVFAPWLEFPAAPSGDPKKPVNPLAARLLECPAPASRPELAARYGELLASLAGDAPRTDPDEEALRQVLCGAGAPTNPAARDVERRLSADERKELDRLRAKVDELLTSHPGSPPRAMAMEDVPKPPAGQKIFRRGDPGSPGEEVPRRFLECLSGPERRAFPTGSGRLDLAREIASPDNALTARVFVNRVWRVHFGEGLVGTPSDFGTQGEAPSHPDLLDWLARDFVAGGFSVKKLHRLILRSAAWRQSSRHSNPEAARTDPENRLLWRAPRRRLDFEATWDSLLAASGRLDLTVGGQPVALTVAPYSTRRALYGLLTRQEMPDLYSAFDFPSPEFHAPSREETLLPQQALFLMNSPFVQAQAEALAARPDVAAESAPERRVARLYAIAYGRAPSAVELSRAVAFAARSPKGWGRLAHVLLLSGEFHFVD